MTRLLAIDTATEFCSVAYTDGTHAFSVGEEMPRRHSQRLLPFVDQVLAEAGVSLAQLSAIVVSQGPGSFTGVRIGASMAQGLAFSCDLPLLPVSTLAAMAQACVRLYQAEQAAVAIDARMGEVYWGTYRQQQGLMLPVADEIVCAPEAVRLPDTEGTWWTAGTGWESYAEAMQQPLERAHLHTAQQVRLPHAEDMLTLGMAALKAGKAIAADDLQPHYLRNEVTWQKLPGR